MKKLVLSIAVAGAAALAGCGTDNKGTPDASIQPNGTVPVNFSVDDTANKVYKDGDLEWKGAMKYDPTTRTITKDSSWGGPYAKLYDDGPWVLADGGMGSGHEPSGATAGDNKWGVTVFAPTPATGTDTYSYGLNDANACSTAADAGVAGCNGWSWLGDNGSFDVAAGATAPVNASGRSFSKFGNVDLQLKAVKSQLISQCALTTPASCTKDADCGDPNQFCLNGKTCALKQSVICTSGGAACPTGQTCTPPDTSKVTLKGSAEGWSEVELKDDGSGNFIFTQSAVAGAGKALPHAGLLNSGDTPEFVFVFNGLEYRDRTVTGAPCAKQGVTASTGAAGGPYTSQTVSTKANGNTYITVP